MLPVVSSSAHNSLPRDGHKDAQKTRSSEISGRKNQAHGFKPLFPIDTSNRYISDCPELTLLAMMIMIIF
jgi:hypothetical protein